MKRTIIVFAFMFLLSSLSLAQPDTSKKGIVTASMNYIEGWYEGNADRVQSALHPDLAKRMVYIDKETQKSKLMDLSRDKLVEYTRKGGGKKIPPEKRNISVEILDMMEQSATVKITSLLFTDYVHLIKWNGEWKIINVLWENHKQ